MSFSKRSSMGGAPLYSPESTLISGSITMHAHQTPSTENSSGPNALVPAHGASGYTTEDCLGDIRQLCKESQGRVQALSQAIGRQPGMPSSLTDLLNNDLRVVAQQFATITYYCRMLEKQVAEDGGLLAASRLQQQQQPRPGAAGERAPAHHDNNTPQVNNLRLQLQESHAKVAKLEQKIRDMSETYSTTDKRRRVELEKKKEKIDNQKRRIKEQQDQIDNLKKKAIDGGKSSRAAKARNYEDSSPEPSFPHSATSDLGGDRKSTPPFPEPKYSSTLDGKDEEFLLSNLKKLNTDFGPSGLPFPPPPAAAAAAGATGRMERDNHGGHHHGAAAPPYPAPYGPGAYGPQMPGMGGPLGGPMHGGAMPPYGAFHQHMNHYGPPPTMHTNGFGRGAGMPPNNGHGPGGPFHGGCYPNGSPVGYRGPGGRFAGPPPPPSRSASHSARGGGSDSHHNQQSNALVVRRNDDAEFDPETKVWKDMFYRLFNGVNGWTHTFAADSMTPGAAEAATQGNARLWQYMLKVAACYKDAHAAPKHALFLLTSPEHRPHFLTRLVLQYVEQEVLHPKFWLGWDDETDAAITKLGPVLDYIGYPLEQRRAARQQLRVVVEGIVRDEEYPRFRSFKTHEHTKRLKDIVGPFLASPISGNTTASKDVDRDAHDASVGLLSLANVAMEISHKMMVGRLSFAFTWNECAVKFSADSHLALNSDLQALALQHKHTRICLVVTPSISYRDDSGVSIVPRGVTKAQVLVMN